MNFSLKVIGLVFIFFLFHVFDVWPLPVHFYTLVSEITTLWFFVEIAFYIYFRASLKHLQWFNDAPANSDSKSPELRRKTFEAMIGVMSLRRWGDCGDHESFLCRWFLGTVSSARDIRRGNATQWLAWSYFYRLPPMLNAEERSELDDMLAKLEAHLGFTFRPGFDPHQRSMRLSLDPASGIHRPLFVYCIQAVSSSVSKLVLRLAFGFTRRKLGGFHYWHKLRSHNKGRDKLPLVFIHGLGQGLIAYLHFLYHVRDRDVFLVELSHISARVWERIPDPAEVAKFVECMLQEHNYARAVFMSHSFGTFASTWCLKYTPGVVHSVMLIDPVTLLLCYPTTCHTFVYRQPRSFADWVRRLAVAQEIGIVRVMMRHFWWRENALFIDDLPPALPAPATRDCYAYYPSADPASSAPAAAATAASAAAGAGAGTKHRSRTRPVTPDTAGVPCLADVLLPVSPLEPAPAAAAATTAALAAGPSACPGRPALPFMPVPSEMDAYGVFTLCGLHFDAAAERGLGHWRVDNAAALAPGKTAGTGAQGTGAADASVGAVAQGSVLLAPRLDDAEGETGASLDAGTPVNDKGAKRADADAAGVRTRTNSRAAATTAAAATATTDISVDAGAAAGGRLKLPRIDTAAVTAAAAAIAAAVSVTETETETDTDTDADNGTDTGADVDADCTLDGAAIAAAVAALAARPHLKVAVVLAGQDDLLPADRILNHFRLRHLYTHSDALRALAASFPSHIGSAGASTDDVGDPPLQEGDAWGPDTGSVPLPPRGLAPRPEAEWDAVLPDVIARANAADAAAAATAATADATTAATQGGSDAESSAAATAVASANAPAGAVLGATAPLDAAAATAVLRELLRVRILYEPDGGHGHFLFSSATRRRVLGLVPWLADEA